MSREDRIRSALYMIKEAYKKTGEPWGHRSTLIGIARNVGVSEKLAKEYIQILVARGEISDLGEGIVPTGEENG